MIGKIFFVIPIRILAAVVLLYIGWQAAVFLMPRPADFAPDAATLLRGAAQEAASGLAGSLGGAPAPLPLRIGVVRLSDDTYGSATAMLRDALDDRPEFTVDRTPVVQRFLKDIGTAVLDASSLDELTGAGRKVALDLLVTGRVMPAADTATPPHLELRVMDLRPGGRAQHLEVAGRLPRVEPDIVGLPDADASASQSGGGWRWLLFIVAVVALPWLTPFITRLAVERKSNASSALLVSGYVVADLLLLAVAAGGIALRGWHIAWVALVAALCMVYNTWTCDVIAGKQR